MPIRDSTQRISTAYPILDPQILSKFERQQKEDWESFHIFVRDWMWQSPSPVGGQGLPTSLNSKVIHMRPSSYFNNLQTRCKVKEITPTWYLWKHQMARKNVIHVSFSNARKVGFNWSLEAVFANYNFFQSSSAFHETRNYVHHIFIHIFTHHK